MSDITLSAEELYALTEYDQATKQLGVLHSRGFTRAFINRHGKVVLERAHFEAVEERRKAPAQAAQPALRPDVPRPLHWRERPEHRQRLVDEQLAWIEHEREKAELDATIAAEVAAWELEEAKLRPARRAALVRHHSAKRRTAKLQRTPKWADFPSIRAVYAEADHITRETGIPHHVDHEIPLQGKLVSGLHVHNNLQILTGSENSKKRNHFEV